jgi:hypothetical protein
MNMKMAPINGKMRRPKLRPPVLSTSSRRKVAATSKRLCQRPGTSLALRAIAAPTISSSPMTTKVMNREFVTLTGPTVKRVSGAIAMWISIRGRYSSCLSISRADAL